MVSFTEDRLQELLRSFQGKKIAVVGDMMVDRYYWGRVGRISPEAPVPVVDVSDESIRLGGAANVARNIHSLGGTPLLVGLVGNDHPGMQLLEILKDLGMDASGIVVDPSRPTTIKTRVIAEGQHVVRIDNESKADCPEHLEHLLIDAVKYNVHSLDAIVLEDYNKGVVTRRVIEEITAVATKYGKVITVDPKFNHFLDFRNVTVFKPNRREVEEVLGGRLRSIEDVHEVGRRLVKEIEATYVLLTRGEDGMSLFESGGGVTHFPSVAEQVQDVSGAGDTVISTLTLALAGGASIHEAAALANCAAGMVVAEVGIVPIQPEQLVAFALRRANRQHAG